MSQHRRNGRTQRAVSESESEPERSQVEVNLANPEETARHLFLQSIWSHRTLAMAAATAVYKEINALCKSQYRSSPRLGRSRD